MGNLMLSLKVALISAAVVSAAVIFKLFVPLVSDFIVSDIPSLYTIILSYLRPPYLYLLINGIIISIVASSKFHPRSVTNPAPAPVPADRVSVNAYNGAGPAGDESGISTSDVYSNAVEIGFGYGDAAAVPAAKTSSVEEAYNGATFRDVYIDDGGSGYDYGDATVVEDRTADTERVVMDGGDNTVKAPERMDTAELLSLLSEVEKPPVSRRFAQRKTVKALHHLPEGKALGVTKPKRHDTLESTWKTITEGRHMPLTRHLKKSDTWERVQKEQQHASSSTVFPNKTKKSETLSDGKATTASGTTKDQSPVTRSSESGKLRKEPSLSQDELNRRVEAFIKKVNEEMRLQRQESLNQYQAMIRRGAN
ncbi:hypothetical protein SLEP1_g49914 [Rubroshorea leprosula]|uniref:DUF4408 domain-containing protein n=1 Tax=Rubroshorea leprosula TaxID=152421 RepID=A0AAV5M0D1_9ROSI|nr:hypothetical protein SLEP1_g49914 [Rubroshorea leprosula]